MKKSETTQLLAELKNLANLDIEKRVEKPIKKNLEIYNILSEIKNDVLKSALEEQEFYEAKQRTISLHNKELKHLQELADNQRIQQQINDYERSKQISPPVVHVHEPIITQHIDMSTQMIDFKLFQKTTNQKLIKTLRVPVTFITFVLSLIFFYSTNSHTITPKPKAKIVFNKPKIKSIKFKNEMWPEYVWSDIYQNVSPDYFSLTLKELLNISLEDKLESSRVNAGITRVNKTKINKIKTPKKTKLQLNIDINSRDY